MRSATSKPSGQATRRGKLYEPLDWVLVRAPLLPIETYLALPAPNGEAARARYDALSADPRIGAALAVGGGNLYAALDRTDPSGKDDPASAGKLLRYLIRMSTRPTPYGLFAGVALARWGERTDLSLAPARPRTRTRPDMAWLLNLVFEAEKRPEVRRQLAYLANPRAYIRAGRAFLPEAAPGASGPGPAVSARATNVMRQALAFARAPVSHERLVAELAKAPGATAEKVEKLVAELWQQTLLLTDLRPPLTGRDPAAHVAERLRGIPEAADLWERLEAARAAMAQWDSLPIEKAASAYRRLAPSPAAEAASSSEVPSQGDVAQVDMAQVDMALTLRGCRIASAIAEEAARAAELLLRLTPLPAGLPYLESYRRAFEARYGPGREVKLLELLDPNFGLGPPSQFHGGAAGGDPRKAAQRQQALYELAVTALRERQLVVELDEAKLARLESWTPAAHAAPQSLDLSVFVVAGSAEDVDGGRFRLVVGPNLGAGAAGRNLGRFADLLGEEGTAALRVVEHAEGTDGPGCVSAEIAYLPRRGRSANVVIRPNLRPYEISLGTTPARTPDRVIPLDDLVVGTRQGRFTLRWPARDVEVIVCTGHMLNNMQAPDVCRFLEDMRRDGRAQFTAFDWAGATGLPVLPRVQAGRIVLCPAQWRIDARVRDELATNSPAGFAAALGQWRTRWQVPRHVYLTFADNRLLLDLEDDAQADELRTELRHLPDGGQILLQEALPGPDDAWMEGPDGHFIAELVVPLALHPAKPSPDPPASSPRPVAAGTAADRLRPPGSDWLFAKLYSPRTFEDDLLTGHVAEFCRQMMATGAADDWFFIRYADPDPHLRLRFHGNPERLAKEVFPLACSWANRLLGEELCTRLCFDTYDREIERYGGAAGTEVAEAIFGADSRAVVELLRLSRGGLLAFDMTSLAALSIDSLIAALGLDEAERLAWYRERVPSRSAASDEYRRRKDVLRRILGDPESIGAEPGGDALLRVLAARAHELAAPAHRLDALAAANALGQPKADLLRSYVHLHCNRLLADRVGEDQVLALLGRTRYGLSQYRAAQPDASGMPAPIAASG